MKFQVDRLRRVCANKSLYLCRFPHRVQGKRGWMHIIAADRSYPEKSVSCGEKKAKWIQASPNTPFRHTSHDSSASYIFFEGWRMIYQTRVSSNKSLSGAKPRQALMKLVQAARCLFNEFTTSVPGLTTGAFNE